MAEAVRATEGEAEGKDGGDVGGDVAVSLVAALGVRSRLTTLDDLLPPPPLVDAASLSADNAGNEGEEGKEGKEIKESKEGKEGGGEEGGEEAGLEELRGLHSTYETILQELGASIRSTVAANTTNGDSDGGEGGEEGDGDGGMESSLSTMSLTVAPQGEALIGCFRGVIRAVYGCV